MQRLRRLCNDKSERVKEQAFVIEGSVLIAEAIRTGWKIESQFVSRGASACSGAGSEVHTLEDGVIERVASTVNPQPVIAIAQRRQEDYSALGVANKNQWVVVVDKVSDPGNLGTILRSAEAAGAAAVLLTTGSVEAFSPKVVRSSAGAIFNIPIFEAAIYGDLSAIGFKIFGSSSHEVASSVNFVTADLSGRVAIVLGNEAHGLAHDTPVDHWLTIPHSGRAESLNVAMAATLLCFEVKRQHNN